MPPARSGAQFLPRSDSSSDAEPTESESAAVPAARSCPPQGTRARTERRHAECPPCPQRPQHRPQRRHWPRYQAYDIAHFRTQSRPAQTREDRVRSRRADLVTARGEHRGDWRRPGGTPPPTAPCSCEGRRHAPVQHPWKGLRPRVSRLQDGLHPADTSMQSPHHSPHESATGTGCALEGPGSTCGILDLKHANTRIQYMP